MVPPWFTSDIRPLLPGVLDQPYWYGAGGIICPWPYGGPGGGANAPYGFDCSGFVLRAWFRLGLITPLSPVGRRARDCAAYCESVALGEQMPGDIATYIYNGEVCHVRLVVCPPEEKGGHSLCWGADGGGSSTKGTDPEACVKESGGDYWSAFAGYKRIPDTEATRFARFAGPLLLKLAQAQPLWMALGQAAPVPGLEEAEKLLQAGARKLYPIG